MSRNIKIDLIKACAIFFVISIHFLLHNGYYELLIDNGIMVIWTGLRCIFIVAVPLFLIATGFLMNRKTLSEKYILGIVPVLIKYIIISLMIWFFSTLFLNDSRTFFEGVMGIFGYTMDSYSWYVEMYIGLYLIIPFLNIGWHYKVKERYHLYIIYLSSIMIFLPTFLNSFGKVIPNYWQFGYPIAYYLIGAWLSSYSEKVNNLSLRKTIRFFLSSVCLITFINITESWGIEFQWEGMNDYFGYQTALIAVLVVFILWKVKVPKKCEKILIQISDATLCIYLISDFTDALIYGFFNRTIKDGNQLLIWGGFIIIINFLCATVAGILINYVINMSLKRIENKRRRIV